MSDAMVIGPSVVSPSGVIPAGGCGCGGDLAAASSEPVVSASVKPSMADAPDGQNIVYALGNLSYDFGTEARRDSFKQLMPPVK